MSHSIQMWSFNAARTNRMNWLLFFAFQAVFWANGRADIFIQDFNNHTIDVLSDFELNLGMPVPDEGIWAVVQQTNPSDACDSINPPDHNYPPLKNSSFKWFALVDRAINYCDIQTKIFNVMKAGFDGIIIYKANIINPGRPSMFDDTVINIPVLLITPTDGNRISKRYTYEKNFHMVITNNSTFNYYPYLLPFLAVIAICLLVMLSFMVSQIVRCYHERKKEMKHRLAKKYLKKLPIVNFKKGDQYEVCAICLDEFTEGTKLRVLPCGHAYHLKCIDPWLTKNRRNCPICKGKVVVPGMSESESDSEVDNQNSNERTPLISGNSFTYGLGPFSRRPNRLIGQSSGNNYNVRNETGDTITTGQNESSQSDARVSASGSSGEPAERPLVERSHRVRSSHSKRSKRSRLLNIRAEITPNPVEPSTSDMMQNETSSSSLDLTTSDLVTPVVVVEPSASTSGGNMLRSLSTNSPTSNRKQRRSDGIV